MDSGFRRNDVKLWIGLFNSPAQGAGLLAHRPPDFDIPAPDGISGNSTPRWRFHHLGIRRPEILAQDVEYA